MADYPVSKHNNKTPLQVAKKPNMDFIAQKGRNGLLKTIPIRALSDAIRISKGRINVTPTPTVGPLIATITGFNSEKYCLIKLPASLLLSVASLLPSGAFPRPS